MLQLISSFPKGMNPDSNLSGHDLSGVALKVQAVDAYKDCLTSLRRRSKLVWNYLGQALLTSLINEWGRITSHISEWALGKEEEPWGNRNCNDMYPHNFFLMKLIQYVISWAEVKCANGRSVPWGVSS